MHAIEKHPDSTILVTVDFSRRLVPGLTVQSIASQPAVRGTADTVVLGEASINGAAILPPNGGFPVGIGAGVQFTIAGGFDDAAYVLTLKVTLSDGTSIAIDIPLRVSRSF